MLYKAHGRCDVVKVSLFRCMISSCISAPNYDFCFDAMLVSMTLKHFSDSQAQAIVE